MNETQATVHQNQYKSVSFENPDFGHWTVVGAVAIKEGNGRWKVRCRCRCGYVTDVVINTLIRRKSRSCGCIKKGAHPELGKYQGRSKTLEYTQWRQMISRCHNPEHHRYPLYGARGIKVCDRWRENFLAFSGDMGPRPDGHTLDRIDNDGDYAPGNCRWATQKQQMNNTRANRLIEFNGTTRTMKQWAETVGMPYTVLARRIYRGWPVEAAITTPNGNKRRATANA